MYIFGFVYWFEFKIQIKLSNIYSIYIIGDPPNVELLQSVDGNTYACPR